MARMTEKYLKYRAKQVLENIKTDKIYDMEKHEHDDKRKRKDGRSRVS